MKKLNQTIKCNVFNCKYNNNPKYLCTLNEIDISSACNENTCNNKKETICNSFIKK